MWMSRRIKVKQTESSKGWTHNDDGMIRVEFILPPICFCLMVSKIFAISFMFSLSLWSDVALTALRTSFFILHVNVNRLMVDIEYFTGRVNLSNLVWLMKFIDKFHFEELKKVAILLQSVEFQQFFSQHAKVFHSRLYENIKVSKVTDDIVFMLEKTNIKNWRERKIPKRKI